MSPDAKIRSNYDVFAGKRVAHSATPTPLNSAADRGQHRCIPGLLDGLRSKTKEIIRVILGGIYIVVGGVPRSIFGYVSQIE